MRLRATLEKFVPLRENEIKLSPAERRTAFRGQYYDAEEVTGVEAVRNRHANNQERYPYQVGVIRRTYGGWDNIGGRSIFSTVHKTPPDVAALNAPPALQRINRIEKIARIVKLSTLVAALGASCIAAYTAGTEGVYDTRPLPPAHAQPNKHSDDWHTATVDGAVVFIPGEGEGLGATPESLSLTAEATLPVIPPVQ